MPTIYKPKDIDQLMAEADALIEHINSSAIEDMEEERRIRIELQAQRLKKLRAEVQERASKEGSPESGSYGEGMHQAILEIMAAVKNLGGDLS
jgi:hypothetical protein